MASINLGTFSDGWSGIPYTCYLIHDTPTRSGDNITVKNVKFRIVSQTGQGTEGRTAVTLYMPSSTKRVENGTIAGSYVYPTDKTYTAVGTTGYTFSNLSTSFSYSVSVSDTGYGSTWNSTYSKTFTGSITCPARTYTVSYNANGGSGAPSSQSKTYNVALTLSSTVPTYSGYTFKGWATSSTGAVTYQPGGSYTGNAAITLFAIWEQEYVPPEPRVIGFRGIWITATSKLANVLKNIVIKIVNQENRFLDAATSDVMLQIITSKMNSLTSTYAVDYIVDQGTWGTGGKWIKWNSGIYECWGIFSQSLKIQDQYGNMYYQGEWTTGTWEIIQTLPDGFVAAPVVSINFIRSTGLVVPSVTLTSAASVKFHIASAQRETTAGTIYYLIKAIGRWK